jgi:carboxyl-terminal processing protease
MLPIRLRISACLIAATVTVAACGGASATAPTATTPPFTQVPAASRLTSDYANELVNTMQQHSINRGRIDWTDFRAQVFQRASGAQTIVDLYPAISLALGLLDDHHSFYQAVGSSGLGNPRGPRCSAVTAGTPVVAADIGYVRIGSFGSAVSGADRVFADAIQDQIRQRDAANLAGWIVDVRGNGGGNMWPMVAGVGPVLGEGIAGFFVYPSGMTVSWSYQGGMAMSGTSEVVRTTTPYVLLERLAPRVAVLTDNLVASSGEVVVVSFRGRPNTRSFGSGTCGLSTVNTGYRLSDGATLQLTTGTQADRNRTAYGNSIAPDETLAGDAEVVQRAIDWLRGE